MGSQAQHGSAPPLYVLTCCGSNHSHWWLLFTRRVSLGDSAHPHIYDLPFPCTRGAITQTQRFASVNVLFIYLSWDKISCVPGWPETTDLKNDGTTDVYHHDLLIMDSWISNDYRSLYNLYKRSAMCFWVVLIPGTNLGFNKIVLAILLFSGLNMECIEAPVTYFWKRGFFIVRHHLGKIFRLFFFLIDFIPIMHVGIKIL